MTRKNGVRYSQEKKEAIIKRMMPPNNESVAQISKEEGISNVTLYKWRKAARAAGVATPGNGQTSENWSSQDKFLIVMETFAMNESELAEYCRKKVCIVNKLNHGKVYVFRQMNSHSTKGKS